MLRSVINAPIACFFGVSTSQHARCAHPPCAYTHRKLAFSSLRLRSPPPATGRMADVLDILGPLDSIFPPAAARLFVGLLTKCVKSGDTVMGSIAQAHLMKSGLGAEPLVSNVLLNVYAKAGHLDQCTKVFDEMPLRDMVSWCTLISGYVHHGFDVEAFGLLKGIYGSGSKPNHFIVSAVLKGCSNSENLEVGTQVHTTVIKSGLIFDSFVEVGLISMYAKSGDVGHALKLFYEIPVKCLVSWNAMISGYVQNGLFSEAMELCHEMCRMGFIMDLVTLRIVASVGSASVMLNFCRNLHAYSIKIGLDADNYVVAEHLKLLSMLGQVDDIGKLFARVRKPDACLVALTISGYYINGHRLEALKHAEQLFRSELNMNEGAAVSVLNLCLVKEDGRQIHAYFLKSGHDTCLSVSNALISMYINCGSMEDAKIAFAEMPIRDIVSWTAIISGHVHNSHFGEAFKVFQSCWKSGMLLDQYTFATVVNACTGLRALDHGKQIHALVLKIGIEISDFLAASLLHMYAKCGDINSTTRLFSNAPCPHGLVPVNVMLAGYCWNSQPEKALQLFHREYLAGFLPDEFTFSTILGACADLRSLDIGQQLHSHIIKSGFELSDIVVGNAMINLYARSGNIENACRSFNGMTRWDSNSYAMLISGYVQNRCSKLAVDLFCQMHRSGLRANPVAFTSILRGCANLAALELGKQVHASVLKVGFVSDICVVNSLMGMYTKSRDMDGAAKVLNGILIRDDFCWNSVISGYSKKQNEGQAYKMLDMMKLETLLKECFGYKELFKTGVMPSALMQGISIYSCQLKDDFRLNCSVGNALFVMYCRSIFLEQLQSIFRNVMTAGVDTYTYAESGLMSKLVKLLLMESTKKGKMVHMLLLYAYCHYDLIKKGLFCPNTGEGQPHLSTEGCCYSMVKIPRGAVGFDVNPESISLVHLKFNALVHLSFLAMCRSHRNIDSQRKITVDSATYPFTTGLKHSVMEEPVFVLLENEDRVLVILVGFQIGSMASQTSLKEQRFPSPFTFHHQEYG